MLYPNLSLLMGITPIEISKMMIAFFAIGTEVSQRCLNPDSLQRFQKNDLTPVTEIDLWVHAQWSALLQTLTPNIPILSEESWQEDQNFQPYEGRYWLMDPIDGTRELIAGTGEFTLNVALVEKGQPIIGFIYSPVDAAWYIGINISTSQLRLKTSWKLVSPYIGEVLTGTSRPSSTLIQLVSRRSESPNENNKWNNFLQDLELKIITKAVGSSLKFCRLAEGRGDIYPRFTPTSHWDIAAGHAILLGAGGSIVQASGKTLEYPQPGPILNPHFLATAFTLPKNWEDYWKKYFLKDI